MSNPIETVGLKCHFEYLNRLLYIAVFNTYAAWWLKHVLNFQPLLPAASCWLSLFGLTFFYVLIYSPERH